MGAVLQELNKTSTPQVAEATQAPVESKSSLAVAGSVTVNVVDDSARAYVYKAGNISTGNLLLDAKNESILGSLAGSVAFAKAGDPTKSATAIAGAFGRPACGPGEHP